MSAGVVRSYIKLRHSLTKMPMEKIQEYWIEDSIKDKVFDDFYILGNELGK